MCCRIINSTFVFFVFAILGLAALDFGFLFSRWQKNADEIAGLSSTTCAPSDISKDALVSIEISDWFTEIPMGVQVHGLTCTVPGMIVGTPATCQFSQPGDALRFTSIYDNTAAAIASHEEHTYFVPCYTVGTTINSKLVYTGFVLGGVLLAVAVFVPIMILACCRKVC